MMDRMEERQKFGLMGDNNSEMVVPEGWFW